MTGSEAQHDKGNAHSATETAGVGLQLDRAGGSATPCSLPTVRSIVQGSAAENSEISPGDALLAVDGSSVAGLALSKVRQAICGPKGTTVELTLSHSKEGGESYTVVLVRFVPCRGSDGAMLGSGIVEQGGFRRAIEVGKRVVAGLEQRIVELEVRCREHERAEAHARAEYEKEARRRREVELAMSVVNKDAADMHRALLAKAEVSAREQQLSERVAELENVICRFEEETGAHRREAAEASERVVQTEAELSRVAKETAHEMNSLESQLQASQGRVSELELVNSCLEERVSKQLDRITQLRALVRGDGDTASLVASELTAAADEHRAKMSEMERVWEGERQVLEGEVEEERGLRERAEISLEGLRCETRVIVREAVMEERRHVKRSVDALDGGLRGCGEEVEALRRGILDEGGGVEREREEARGLKLALEAEAGAHANEKDAHNLLKEAHSLLKEAFEGEVKLLQGQLRGVVGERDALLAALSDSEASLKYAQSERDALSAAFAVFGRGEVDADADSASVGHVSGGGSGEGADEGAPPSVDRGGIGQVGGKRDERQVERLRIEVMRLVKEKEREVARLEQKMQEEVMRLRERVGSLEDERGTLSEEVVRLTSLSVGHRASLKSGDDEARQERELERARSERDAAIEAAEGARGERDAAIEEVERFRSERDAAIEAVERFRSERDAAVDALRCEMERQREDLVEGLRRGELPSRGGTPIKSNRFDSTSRGGTPIKSSQPDFEGQLGTLSPTRYTRSGGQGANVDGLTARHTHDADEPMQMDRYLGERDALSGRLREAEAGLESARGERDALSGRLREAEAGLKANRDEAQDLRVERARLAEALGEASKNALAIQGGGDHARLVVEESVVKAMFQGLREETRERVRGLGEGLSLLESLVDSFESQLSGLDPAGVGSEGRGLEMGHGDGSESEGGGKVEEEDEGEENVSSEIHGGELTVAGSDEDGEEIYKEDEAQHLQKRVSELEADLKGKEDEAQNLQDSIDSLERQREEAKREEAELMKKVQELEEVMDKELEEARASVGVLREEKERQVEGLRVEVVRLEDRAGAMKEEVMRLEKEKEREVARLVKEKEREVMRLRGRVSSLEDERGTLKEEVVRLTSVMAGLEGSHRAIRDAVGDALEAERDAVSEGRVAIRRASERHHLFAGGAAKQGRESGAENASEKVCGGGGGGGCGISEVEDNRGKGGVAEEGASWELETLREHVVTIEGLLSERELEIDDLLEQVDSLRSRNARDQ